MRKRVSMRAIIAVALVCVMMFAMKVNASETDKTEPSTNVIDKQGRGPMCDDDSEKAKLEEKNKKWDSLSTDQKEAVYKLIGEKNQTQQKIMDMYVKYGIMDKQEVDQIKADMDARLMQMKKAKTMPFHGFRRPKCGCGREKRSQD